MILLYLFCAISSTLGEKLDCCETKENGGTIYKLVRVDEDITKSYNCKDGCIYEDINEDDSRFCFRYGGEHTSKCNVVIGKPISTTTPSSITTTTTTTPTPTTTTTTSFTTTTTTTTLTMTTEKILNDIFIDPPTSVARGTWGESEFCPSGSFASAYDLKIAPICTRRCRTDDDIGLMGVRLYCTYPRSIDVHDVIGIVTSSVTDNSAIVSKHRDRTEGRYLWPYWTLLSACPQEQFLKSARYLSEPFIIQIDDVEDPTGGQNLDMRCTDGTNLPGEGVQTEDAVWLDWESCPDGMAVCGIRSRLYDEETDFRHNLGHTQLRFHCCELPKYIFIDPPTSVARGTWGESEFCPSGSYASAYDLKIAPICTRRCATDDDIALMGVRLHCTYPGRSDVLATVTSSVTENSDLESRHRDRTEGRSLWPYWTVVKTCPNHQFLKSARYLSEPFPNVQINGNVEDPTGGENLDMKCTDGTNLPGEGVQTAGAVWLDWESCPDGMAVCGIRSRLYDEENDYRHNLGHTQIRLYCCELSMI